MKLYMTYDTVPNGHFGGKVQLSKEDFKSLLAETDNSPKTINGFNMFTVIDNTVKLGYNHRDIAQKYVLRSI